MRFNFYNPPFIETLGSHHMKKTSKYIKTRGQKTNAQTNNLSTMTQPLLNGIHKKQTTSSAKDQSIQKYRTKKHYRVQPKSKQIVKALSSGKKNKILKQKSHSILKKIKSNKTKEIKKVNEAQFRKKTGKIKQANQGLSKQKIKIQPNEIKQSKAWNKKQIKLKQIKNQQKSVTKIQSPTEINRVSLNLKQTSKSKTAKQHIQHLQKKASTKMQQKSQTNIIKPLSSQLKINNFQLTHPQPQRAQSFLPKSQLITEIEQKIKKKGRPKKILEQTKIEERSIEEQKELDQFIEHAIKLRKLKNEKQFFQSFTRICQYVKESWQYGDLGKKVSCVPHRQDILKTGIQVVRGIRKQLQNQQLTNQTG